MNENEKMGIRPLPPIILFLAVGAIAAYFLFLSAPSGNAEEERFIIPLNFGSAEISEKLKSEGFVKNILAFNAVRIFRGNIEPGGYKISKAMSAWKIAGILTKDPYMKWIVIPEGLRKEEIADILAEKLDWTAEGKNQWIKKDTAISSDYFEGVYFPDTYLIPKDESPEQVAKRLQAKFQEKFAPYASESLRQNIRWPTLIRVASLIQREAGGKADMPVIAGVLWNRLLRGMKLDIDATIQYARGNKGEGWWAAISVADKKIDSPYNTYMYKGLPPHPIANPGLDAIKAALYPAKTDCLYYLHDTSGVIHCAKTYEEHKANISRYYGAN